MRGDALSAAGSYTEALDAYNAALAIDRLDDGLDIDIKIAKTYAAFGDYANALTRYDDISSRTGNDYIKSQMDYLAGYAYVTIGQTNEGYQRYQHTVENYPLSYYSYLALLELVAANVDVNDFNRGLVDYYAGQYDVALAAFDRYLASGAADDGTAHYYRAQTLWALDRPADALSEFNLFISKYPDNDKWSNAWGDKADLLWQDMNNFPDAAQTLLDFVAAVPTHEDADNFLFDAGRIYERDNRLDQAAAAWEQLADSYPGSELATEALFQAGIVSYRSNDFNRAQTDFQRGLLLTVESKDQARSYLWVGKTQQKLGDTSAAQKAWQQAQSLDPTGYYSERAKDLLMGQAPFTDPPSYNLDIDMQAERREAASWLRLTFNLPADTNLDGPGPLLQDARMVRGTELWELGLYDQARLEFESLRKDVNMDAANSFRLANYLLDLGLYRSAIAASNQVLSLAGQDLQNSTLQAPDYFKHVRYGLYYKDLIVPAAQKNNFSPLFLFSVIWQESQFEGFVRSTAGAHGLMQIIPSTGANLAIQLAWPLDFKPEDLYRPNVSIELGSYYLASNRDLLDGNLYAALAAYNAGPGNAVIWDKLAGDDPDLLLEIIRYDETRQYIRYIYEVYTIYKTLYGPGI
jgi:soluble lytic murein transglycosylase